MDKKKDHPSDTPILKIDNSPSKPRNYSLFLKHEELREIIAAEMIRRGFTTDRGWHVTPNRIKFLTSLTISGKLCELADVFAEVKV